MAVNNTVLASALQYRSKGYLDSVSKQIALWEWFKKKGRYVSQDGGKTIEWNMERKLDLDEHSYADYDTLVVKPTDQVVTPSANWKSYAAPIVISGEEKRKNTGPTRIFDLLAQKEQNALNSLTQQFNTHLYQDGTGNDGKRITGLLAILPEDPTTGTLYGINRATAGNEFFRSYEEGPVGTAYDRSDQDSPMVNSMHSLRIKCGRLKIGGAKNRYPDVALSTENAFAWYEQVLQKTGLRFRNTDTGDMGFDSVAYHGMTIFHDEDMPQDAGSEEQMYFINSNFWKLIYHPDANMKPTDMNRHVNQDAFSSFIIWMGELICEVPAKSGLLHGITAPQA